MKLEGKVERIESRTRYAEKNYEEAVVSCSLTDAPGGSAACTFPVPMTEAEHWPLGTAVTVTVEKAVAVTVEKEGGDEPQA